MLAMPPLSDLAMLFQVAMMRRIGERMMIADKVPPDYELVYRFVSQTCLCGFNNIELKVEVRRVLGSHEVGVLSGWMCSPNIFTTQHICGEETLYYYYLLSHLAQQSNVGPKWFNAWDGSNGVRPLGVHGSFCNPWSTLHSRPLALYGCSAQNLLQ